MSKVIFLLIGLMIGGFIATVLLCILQLKRINKYEEEIQMLHAKLEKE